MMRILARLLPVSFNFSGVALLLCLSTIGMHAGKALQETLAKQAPRQRAPDLVSMEKAAREIAERVIPCTVGLQVGPAFGSGVVISEDGYILTAAHVIGRPGRDCMVFFPDGRKAKARTLGMHRDADGALVKITEEGSWPFAELVPEDDWPKPGDWCVATGHPAGFQSERTPPLRLGRVIDVDRYTIRSDCTINGGDSGGPLFDMKGRVIGIHSRIGADSTVNLHGPVLEFVEHWSKLKAGKIYPTLAPSRFLDRFDTDRDGRIHRSEVADGFYRSVFDQIIDQFELDPEESYSIGELSEHFGWSPSSSQFAWGGIPIRPVATGNPSRRILASKRYVRGESTLSSIDEITAEFSDSVCRIECDGIATALGTVVGSDGWILTKASQLSGNILCRLSDGRELDAEKKHTNENYDLALLKVAASDLKEVEWSDQTELAPGTVLITPADDGTVLSLGVVSVGARQINGTPGYLGVQIGPGEEARIDRVFEDSGAADAGLLQNDVITHVVGKAVSNIAQLKEAVHQFHAGDVVKATVRRGEKVFEVEVRLSMPEDIFVDDERFGNGRLNGELNHRRDDFPSAVQTDTVLKPTEVGGPVIDARGKVVGINLARADRTVTYVTAYRDFEAFLKKTAK